MIIESYTLKGDIDDLLHLEDEKIMSRIGNNFIIKFGKKAHLREILDGNIRFTHLEDYKTGKGNEEIYDTSEGTLKQENLNLYIKPHGAGNESFKEAGFGSLEISYIATKKHGVFSVSIPLLTLVERTEQCVHMQIDSKYIDDMTGLGYGHALLMSAGILKKGLDKQTDLGIREGFVKYTDSVEFSDRHQVSEDIVNSAFYKRTEFSYQREFRYVTLHAIDDSPYILKIEPFHGIILPIDKLQELFLILGTTNENEVILAIFEENPIETL